MAERYRNIERAKLGPDRTGGDILASTVSRVRGWHERVSE